MFQKSIKRFNPLTFLAPWREMDWMLMILVVGMTFLGGLMIRSTELNRGATDWSQHWITGAVGFVAAMSISCLGDGRSMAF